jgi:hypothetical protein
VLVPAEAGVTDSEPLIGSGPLQSLWFGLAEAVQEVAFVLDQVSITDSPSVIVPDDAESVSVGAGGGGGGGVLPPPHALIKHRLEMRSMSGADFFMTHLKVLSVPASLYEGGNLLSVCSPIAIDSLMLDAAPTTCIRTATRKSR